jgi:hypothetical protein
MAIAAMPGPDDRGESFVRRGRRAAGEEEQTMFDCSREGLLRLAGVLIAGVLLAFSAHAFEQVRFEDLDTNRDGVIDRQEAQAVPELAERFDEFDTTGDGQLNRQEFERALTALDDPPADTPAVRERWEVDR